MKLPVIIVTSSLLLSACSAKLAEPYQADRAPENRDEYSGVEGLKQYSKDQVYLMNKELRDKCETAKLDLIEAKTRKDEDGIARAESLIKQTCQAG
ncbi:hypothetical protein LJ739_08920 [Aestuariibacter halophilus]|uniref:Lipoprotein n=1 Tax=Fluctibacter halophilus TaxID=226011 RepID=A0ABS8G726_9ALTE|nr:hypothetical protein [Aestuariibacter halophilus]MCC2616360.1 hypothetical protein [Aestuariibacter halophilus]